MKEDSGEKPKKVSISMSNYIIEFGFKSKEQVRSFLDKNKDKDIFMDLSCYDPEDFYSDYPQLKGSFAALFCDENKKIEIHFKEKNEAVLTDLKTLGFSPIETTIVSCGFVFPRTIAQIVNEAFFALEEGVASKEDINRAMKFGVNYPKGPFEWSEGRESYFITLLKELGQKTGNERYRICPKLLNS